MTDARPVEIEALLAESAWVRGLAESLVHDPAAAEDIVQETWLAALRRPPVGDRPLRPWLRRVVENFARMRGRGEGARAERERSAARSEGPDSAHDLYERVETQSMLAKVVLEIEEPFRSTLVLRYYEGLSSAEIARRAATPEGTVRWRLKRALELMRERLDRRHGGDRRKWYALLVPLCREVEVAAGTSWLAWLAVLLVSLGIGGAFAARAWMQPAEKRDAATASAPSDVAPTSALEAQRDALATSPVVEPPIEMASSAPAVHTRIVDPSGAAIEGAVLEARLSGGTQRASAAFDGAVQIALAVPQDEIVSFTARAPGFVSQQRRAVVSSAHAVFLGPIELSHAGTLEGTVVDARGRPLENVRVSAETVGSRWQSFSAPPLEEARYLGSMLPDDVPSASTDASGRFRIEELSESYVRLWANCEGFETAWTPEVAVLGGETVQADPIALVELDPRNCIEGVVLAPDGSPLVGARVECSRITMQALFFRGSPQVFRATSGERGRFRICVDPNSRFDLAASDAEERFRPVVVTPLAAGEREVAVRLADWRPLAIAAHGPRGEEVEDFELEFVDARNGRPLVRESEQWRAGTQRAPYTAFVVRALSAHHGEARAGPFVADSPPEAIEIAFAPSASVRGRVLRDGGAVPGARVELIAALEEGRTLVSAREDAPEPFAMRVARPWRSVSTVTSADGRFAVGVEEGSRWWARVETPGSAIAFAGPLRAADDEAPIELAAGGSIAGHVLHDDGAAVEGSLVGLSRGDGYLATRRVGPDGAFRFEHLAPGEWQVRLVREETLGWQRLTFAPGPGSEGEPRWDARVKQGETTILDVRPARSRRSVLAGRLTFDGASVGPWTVDVAREPRGKARAIVDPRGAFEVELSTAGDWSLRAFSSARAGASYELVDVVRVEGERWSYARDWAAAHLEVRASPEVPIKVTWSDGEQARLTLAQDAGADGSALFPRVPAGDVSVSLGEAEPVTIRLAPGEQRVLTMPR